MCRWVLGLLKLSFPKNATADIMSLAAAYVNAVVDSSWKVSDERVGGKGVGQEGTRVLNVSRGIDLFFKIYT